MTAAAAAHAAAPGPEPPWSAAPGAVCAALDVDPARGLSAAEAQRRLERHGGNALQPPAAASAWRILGRQFASLVVALLAAAAAASLAFGRFAEAAAVLVVVAVNAAIGFVTELRAVRSMEALRRLGQATARVRRDAAVRDVPAESLVPGDVVLVEGGDVVAADLRLIEASKLEADESALTGESLPVAKQIAAIAPDAVLAERASMLWKGTQLTRGAGAAACVATGMRTELGRIAHLVAVAEDGSTPLEQRLARLARRLVWVVLAIAVATVVAGVLRGRDPADMLPVGIALAVAAIPEGLPIVATLALARGLWRLARRNALVNRLSAVETLGATSVVLTDKTGTLTENRMTAARYVVHDAVVDVEGAGLQVAGRFLDRGEPIAPATHVGLLEALEIGVLCNNAALHEAPGAAAAEPVGDPTEVALLVAGCKAGLRRADLLARQPERREVAFDPVLRAMATLHADGAGFRVAAKGAAETIVARCTRVLDADGAERPLDAAARAEWLRRSDGLAAAGARVLALAGGHVAAVAADPFADLALAGLVALRDPPRAEVAAALQECRAAGLRVVMVTGDHAGTARATAAALGLCAPDGAVVEGRDLARLDRATLLATDVFARVEPEQKLQLIALHQSAGAVVAMTGDGVNDAPALRQADIGVAMGLRGTQVAREAADMVLEDDSFATIVHAVRQGRAIFANIRRFVVYLLSCNLSEVMVVFFAAGADLPLPVLPLQILYLNLVTDVLPALALGLGEGARDAMQRPPRPAGEPIVTRALWGALVAQGLLIAASVLGALWFAIDGLGLPVGEAVTVSFLTLAFAQLWHVFDLRDAGSRLRHDDVVTNPWVFGALAVCALLLVLAVHGPWLPDVLGTADPGAAGFGAALAASVVPAAIWQAWLALRRA